VDNESEITVPALVAVYDKAYHAAYSQAHWADTDTHVKAREAGLKAVFEHGRIHGESLAG
jgi:hypothetical protein